MTMPLPRVKVNPYLLHSGAMLASAHPETALFL